MKTLAYINVYNELKQRIEDGAYEIGEMLPPEPVLEAMFGVSRITVRRAIRMLTDDGFVLIKPGRGTLVAERAATQRLNYVSSFTQALIERGYAVSLKRRALSFIRDEGIAKELRIGKHSEIAFFERTVLANGRPISVIRNYLPRGCVQGIEDIAQDYISLYQFLTKHFGFRIDTATDTISALNASDELARELEVPKGKALLQNRRISFRAGAPVEAALTITNPDHFSYTANMVGDNT